MRRLVFFALMSVYACADSDPRYGDPSSIEGKTLPGAPTLDFFPMEWDPKLTGPQAVAAHARAGQPVPNPDLSCMGCHGPPTPGLPRGNRALFAGYVGSRAGNGPAKGADVVVIDEAGKRFSGRADDDGFFWVADDGTAKGHLRVAVRDKANDQRVMDPWFAPGNCTSLECHGSRERAGIVMLP